MTPKLAASGTLQVHCLIRNSDARDGELFLTISKQHKTKRYLSMPSDEELQSFLTDHSCPAWAFDNVRVCFETVVAQWNAELYENAEPGAKGGRPARTWIRALAAELHEEWIGGGLRHQHRRRCRYTSRGFELAPDVRPRPKGDRYLGQRDHRRGGGDGGD